jgi:hypothetical protein
VNPLIEPVLQEVLYLMMGQVMALRIMAMIMAVQNHQLQTPDDPSLICTLPSILKSGK